MVRWPEKTFFFDKVSEANFFMVNSFHCLSGRSMQHPIKTSAGFREIIRASCYRVRYANEDLLNRVMYRWKCKNCLEVYLASALSRFEEKCDFLLVF